MSDTNESGSGDTQISADRKRVAVVDYTVKAEVYTVYGADFDPEAVNDTVRRELNRLVPAGVVVERNGAVYAAPDVAKRVEGIDWDALVASIDVAQILADHGR